MRATLVVVCRIDSRRPDQPQGFDVRRERVAHCRVDAIVSLTCLFNHHVVLIADDVDVIGRPSHHRVRACHSVEIVWPGRPVQRIVAGSAVNVVVDEVAHRLLRSLPCADVAPN